MKDKYLYCVGWEAGKHGKHGIIDAQKHEKAWKHGITEAQKHGSTEARKHRTTEARKHRNTDAWKHGCGSTEAREHGSMISEFLVGGKLLFVVHSCFLDGL